MVERCFRDNTARRIRRGSFRNVEAPEKAVRGRITAHDHGPRPFVWTADFKDILPKLVRPTKLSMRFDVDETLHLKEKRYDSVGCEPRHIGGTAHRDALLLDMRRSGRK